MVGEVDTGRSLTVPWGWVMDETQRSSAVWHKSSRSMSGNNECVEVRRASRLVQVRDSKDPDGSILCFTADSWAAFIDQIKTSVPSQRTEADM